MLNKNYAADRLDDGRIIELETHHNKAVDSGIQGLQMSVEMFGQFINEIQMLKAEIEELHEERAGADA